MDQLLGVIVPMAFNFAPKGWTSCEGQLLNITTNQALYALLGVTYGGDGRTTFALPDLRGRSPLGFGVASTGTTYTLGQVSGTNAVTLTPANLPAHSHPVTINANTASSTSDPSSGGYIGGGLAIFSSSTTPNTTLGAAELTIGGAGQSQPLPIAAPYLAMYYNIATTGLFPSRN